MKLSSLPRISFLFLLLLLLLLLGFPSPLGNTMRLPINHSLGSLNSLQAVGALSVQQTYALARNAGFDSNTARRMVAIAQRESRLQPDAACINCIKRSDGSPIRESSIGLWQINTNDPAVWSLVQRATGISSPEQLKDPQINARAAYALYGGSESNLNIAWSINRDIPGGYAYGSVYRSFLDKLPSTEQLEASLASSPGTGVSASSGTRNPIDNTSGDSSPLPVFLANPGDVTLVGESADTTTAIVLIAGALLLVYALS